MNTTDVVTFDAPVLTPPPAASKWDREHAAYLRLLPGLLTEGHKGQYVAIHDGQVVGFGPDKLPLALDAYRRFGKVAVLVRLVTDEPRAVIHIPSVRKLGRAD